MQTGLAFLAAWLAKNRFGCIHVFFWSHAAADFNDINIDADSFSCHFACLLVSITPRLVSSARRWIVCWCQDPGRHLPSCLSVSVQTTILAVCDMYSLTTFASNYWPLTLKHNFFEFELPYSTLHKFRLCYVTTTVFCSSELSSCLNVFLQSKYQEKTMMHDLVEVSSPLQILS